MFPKWSDWDLQYTRKGLVKKRARQILNMLLLASVMIGAFFLRRKDRGDYTNLQSIKHLARVYLKLSLVGISRIVNQAISLFPE